VLWSAVAVNRTLARQRQAEAKLTENEDRLRAVFEHAGVGLAYLTPDGRFLQVNRRLADILGYTPDELLTKTFQEITHPAHLTADLTQLRHLAAGSGGSYTTEKRYLHKDGTAVWVGLTSSAVRAPGGEISYFVSAFNEISDRRRTEEQLRRSEADYRRLVENATIGIFRSSPAGAFLSVNPALAVMLGYDAPDELLRLDIARQVYADPEDRDRLLELLEHNQVATSEVVWKRKDGGRITVRVRLRLVRGAAGEPERLEGLAEDVTQQRSLENQFRQAQRLEAVGRLAGGVAHDFNNILTAITGYSDMLLEELPAHDAKRADVEEIRAAAGRATSLTRQLLAFSRKQVLQTRVLDLNALIRTLERMLQRLIGEDVKLEISLAAELGAVRADPGQIEQIVMNLAVNARDAMPSGGRLTIETANVELDDGYAQLHPGVVPGPYILLAVSDTGTGMDAETRSHLFEPFFTTKEQSKGTGLGLATVYGIVTQSEGHVWVYSEPGRGATFKIYLPRVAESVEPLPLAATGRTAGGGAETVLLAEDDPAVREIASEVLAHRGYRVLRAPEGQTALEMARAHAGTIALLVTDIIMPGMTGRDLAEALVLERPGVRVLYMSGYTDDAVVRHGVLQAGLPYLQKPFTPEDLAHKVRELLDRK
jgi:two-component system, cell cycle sensor histidine kinase and response regulator CckA